MAKANGQDKPVRWAQWASVAMPASAGLQRLLTGAGTLHEGLLNEMGTRADPKWGAQRTVTFPGEKAGVVAAELAAVLQRARAAGDPAAGALAGVAAQLGVREPAAAADQADGG
jgi:hypothetical protein